MSIIQGNSIESGVSTYQIERSLRFNSADSAYLNRTPGSAGNLQTWTWSAWIKRSGFVNNPQRLFYTGNSNNNETGIYFSADRLAFEYYVAPTNYYVVSSAVFRDPSAWYHFVVVSDTTNATSSDRMRIYVNGSRITNFAISSYPAQNANLTINSAAAHYIGRRSDGSNSFDGYLTEVNFIDGQALDPTSFGEYNSETGVWQPKAYTGSYGTNGFYLDFADNSSTTALGYDAAGSNDWTPNNFSVTAGAGNDSLVDTPTPYGTDTGAGGEVRGNYCTMNGVDQVNSTFSNGNLDVIVGTGGGSLAFGNFPMTTGKWYWEIVPTSSTNSMIGIADAYQAIGTRNFVSANGWYYYSNGQKYNNLVGTAYGASYTTNDVIGVAYDADNGSVVFYKNGTSQGTAFTGLTGKGIIPALNNGSSSTTEPYVANFGQRPFAYTAPSGFKALCTQNLPEPTVVDGGDYFNVKLWDGTGATQTITTGIANDLVWTKDRGAAYDHTLFDVIRTPGYFLRSNATSAEEYRSDSLTAFTSTGFSVGADSVRQNINKSGNAYVSWAWKAGGTGVSNTAGTNTSAVVSANTTAGFSIVTYSGTGSNATVGHGCQVGGVPTAPSMVIIKDRDSGSNFWVVGTKSLGFTSDNYLRLNATSAVEAGGGVAWNNTAPTSTTVSLGNSTVLNASGNDYVMYCFAPVEGYSAFGSYTGNGSSDGPFVYLGFRPRYVMWKISSGSTGDWYIVDSVRDTYNVASKTLWPNLSNAEGSGANLIDFVSNGFKVRNAGGSNNGSGYTFIYAAFAENPFKYSLAR